jgi:hypothetical protein
VLDVAELTTPTPTANSTPTVDRIQLLLEDLDTTQLKPSLIRQIQEAMCDSDFLKFVQHLSDSNDSKRQSILARWLTCCHDAERKFIREYKSPDGRPFILLNRSSGGMYTEVDADVIRQFDQAQRDKFGKIISFVQGKLKSDTKESWYGGADSNDWRDPLLRLFSKINQGSIY